jgi:hypothetical protein
MVVCSMRLRVVQGGVHEESDIVKTLLGKAKPYEDTTT